MSTARTLWIGFLSAVLAVASSFAQAALADPSIGEDPQRLVAETIDELIDRLKENSEAIHSDSSIAYRISDELVAPHIDFPRVTRLVIGKYWQGASDQQRQQLIGEIQSLLIRSYVTAMTSYADLDLSVIDEIPPCRSPATVKGLSVEPGSYGVLIAESAARGERWLRFLSIHFAMSQQTIDA